LGEEWEISQLLGHFFDELSALARASMLETGIKKLGLPPT